MSSISRAFTTRRVKQSVEIAAINKANASMPQRSKTTKGNASASASVRTQISAPVELIHTTNMLSYNAPDIHRSDSSSTSVKSSDEESDSLNTVNSSPPTSPDIGSPDSPKESGPLPNHLSCYFVAPGQTKDFQASESPAVPAIPKRSPSHTKKASYDAIARQRSISTMSKESDRTVSTKASMTFSRASSTSTAASSISHTSVPPSPKPPVPSMPPVTYQQQQQPQQPKAAKPDMHPFGRELAQVSEIAEEFGIKHSVLDQEEQAMKRYGLQKHSAEAYLSDVQDLFAKFFYDSSPAPPTSHAHRPPPLHSQPAAALWI